MRGEKTTILEGLALPKNPTMIWCSARAMPRIRLSPTMTTFPARSMTSHASHGAYHRRRQLGSYVCTKTIIKHKKERTT